MDKKYICPCGLLCEDCLFFKPEIYETARKLKELIKSSQLDIFLNLLSNNEGWKPVSEHLKEEGDEIRKYFKSFTKLPDFMNVLDGLIQLQCKSTCRETGGCSFGGNLHKCEAVKCINIKGYEGCWECSESESCDKLNFVKKAYGEVITENFNAIKEEGFDAVKSRGNMYYAWQKKINS